MARKRDGNGLAVAAGIGIFLFWLAWVSFIVWVIYSLVSWIVTK